MKKKILKLATLILSLSIVATCLTACSNDTNSTPATTSGIITDSQLLDSSVNSASSPENGTSDQNSTLSSTDGSTTSSATSSAENSDNGSNESAEQNESSKTENSESKTESTNKDGADKNTESQKPQSNGNKENNSSETSSKTETKPCKHKNTVIKNKKSATTSKKGYTGDTYCKDCGKKLKSGKSTPKLSANTVTYKTDSGRVYKVEKGVNITEYSMKLNTKTTKSKYRKFELEVLRICNAERKKAGLPELKWYEDAYYFANIRAKELQKEWSHTRPNGKKWSTIYTDNDVILKGDRSENMYMGFGYSVNSSEYPERVASQFLNSPEHRKAILNKNVKKCVIAVSAVDDGNGGHNVRVVQHFFE
jgi:uncharacterized protein YkwD